MPLRNVARHRNSSAAHLIRKSKLLGSRKESGEAIDAASKRHRALPNLEIAEMFDLHALSIKTRQAALHKSTEV